VREIRPLGSYTHQPSLPAFVLGLANVRGRQIVVVDLCALLDLAAAPPQRDAILLIISASRVKIGMLADGVIAVRHADASLARAPVPAAGCEAGWVCGVDRHCNRLLDLPLLLNALRPVIASISQ
jgi:chemotaxis signal transduction protein